MRISDWSSDVCSSDLAPADVGAGWPEAAAALAGKNWALTQIDKLEVPIGILSGLIGGNFYNRFAAIALPEYLAFFGGRSVEHTSELQSLMRTSYAVFCLKKKYNIPESSHRC